MALIVNKEYQGKNIYNTVRIGAIERARKTNIKYAIGFYYHMPLENLLKDLKVDLKQLKYKIQGKQGKILKPGCLLPYSRNGEFKTELKRMEHPKLKNRN